MNTATLHNSANPYNTNMGGVVAPHEENLTREVDGWSLGNRDEISFVQEMGIQGSSEGGHGLASSSASSVHGDGSQDGAGCAGMGSSSCLKKCCYTPLVCSLKTEE